VVVVERVAVDAGLDLTRFRKDLADPRSLDALRRDHLEARREHGVFGTPTFVFPDGASAYVRLAEAPDADHAPDVFKRLLAVVASEPSILEIKRPRRPPSD
jgi:predicted DsbA family dithiol-disulfide isomerase